jgi:hypothetical protein
MNLRYCHAAGNYLPSLKGRNTVFWASGHFGQRPVRQSFEVWNRLLVLIPATTPDISFVDGSLEHCVK